VCYFYILKFVTVEELEAWIFIILIWPALHCRTGCSRRSDGAALSKVYLLSFQVKN